MEKKPILTLEQVKEIEKTYPTPFHIYDEKAIRKNARALKEAFSWNKGYREYFAVKATPNPFILKILHKSLTLYLFSSIKTPPFIIIFYHYIIKQVNLSTKSLVIQA